MKTGNKYLWRNGFALRHEVFDMGNGKVCMRVVVIDTKRDVHYVPWKVYMLRHEVPAMRAIMLMKRERLAIIICNGTRQSILQECIRRQYITRFVKGERTWR